jgi:hypothetical protein
MNPRVHSFLMVSLKQAVNAILTNAAASQIWPHLFDIHTRSGWLPILKLIGTIVGARELMVWTPKVLAWSQSNGDNH